jgi:enediyne biosynthesis protein E4
MIRLEGAGSNRDAVGARVVAVAGGRRQVAPRVGGGSFESAADPRIHLGLGLAERVEELEIRWPSGRVDRFHDLPADGRFLIQEGATTPRPLPGFGPPG